ncbi:MAG: helix-turn-helix transcriptional regulator [Bacillota bacterium]
MSLANNLLLLRKAHGNLSQEALADTLNVSRQTVSKWESGAAYPEVDKLIALGEFFHCSLDQLLREDMTRKNEAYSPVRIVTVERFRMAQYVVISGEPEEDSIAHMERWAEKNGLKSLSGGMITMIGCDMPILSIEQKTVYGLRGYMSAVILPDSFASGCAGVREAWQEKGKYALISIRDPFRAPFDLIPKAYQAVMRHLQAHGIRHAGAEGQLWCFEKVYELDGVTMMDVYVSVDMLTEGGEPVTLR